MEARGIPTEKGDKNRWIKATNNLIEKLKSKIQSILEWIKEQKTKLLQSKEPVPITPIDRIRQYYKQEIRKSGNSPETDKLLKEMASLVPGPGLEPGWVAPLVFETSASTDSAIWARKRVQRYEIKLNCTKLSAKNIKKYWWCKYFYVTLHRYYSLERIIYLKSTSNLIIYGNIEQ